MRILEFRVENFNTIKSISFEEGDLSSVNVIVGDHGQGKSSLLDALTYALTGYLEFPIASYIRLGQDLFTVYVRFVLSDVEYSLLIEGKEKGADKVLKISNEPENVYLNSDATKRIAEVLDPTLTLYSAVARQHNNTGVLFERDSERMEKLKKIFRMTQVDDAVERMKADESKYKESIKLLKKEVELSEKQIEGIQIQKVPDLPDEEKLEEEKIKWDSRKTAYDNWIEQKKKEDEHAKEYLRYVDTRERIQSEIEYFTTELKGLPAIKRIRSPRGLTEEIGKLLSDIQKIDKEILDKQREIGENNQKTFKREQLEMQYAGLTGKYVALLKSKEDKEKELAETDPIVVVSEYGSIEKAQNRNRELLERLNFLQIKKQSHESGSCLVCEHELETDSNYTDEEYSRIENELHLCNQSILEYNQLEKEATKIRTSIKTTEEQIVDIKKDLDEINSNTLLLYISNSAELNLALDNLTMERKELSDKLGELNLQQKQYDTILEQNNNTIAQKERLESKLQEKLKEQSDLVPVEAMVALKLMQPLFDEAEYNAFLKRLKEYEVLVMRVKDIEESNTKLIEQKKNIQAQIDSCNKQIAEQEDRLDSIVSGKKFLDKKFSAYLLTKGSTYVCSKMNEFFGKASDFSNYEISMEIKGNSAQFFYTIEDHEKKMPIGKASGQQKMVIGLAFRIAIGSIRGNTFFVLDEIDESANSESSMRMYSNLLENDAEQIFAITHNEETKKYFTTLTDSRVYEIANGEAIAI